MGRVPWLVRRVAMWSCWMLLGVAPAVRAEFQPTTCNNAFTPQQEIAAGQKAAAQVYQTMPVLPDSDPVVQYVQRIGAKLVAHAPIMPGVGRQWPFNYHVVASADINAFALPGGSIFINLGTIQAAQTEAQLAGVMAHETSHVVMRHSTCNLTKQQHRGLLYGLGSIASAIILGDTAAGALAQEGIGFGQNLDYLHMSRGDERQADLLGTDILYDAGYDPRGLVQFFEIIEAKYGAGGSQMLSDHPNPGNRTEYVKAEIATLPPRTNYVVTTPEFTRMHALAAEEQTFSAKEIQAGVWKRGGVYESGPGAVVAQASAPMPAGSTGGASTKSDGVRGHTGTFERLSRSELGIGARMMLLQATHWAVAYPAGWEQSGDLSGAVTLAPPGGAGKDGIAYGVLIDIAKQDGNGVTDAASLSAAATALLQQLMQQNPGLQAMGEAKATSVNGRPAESVELSGQSLVMQAGSALPEHDWLVAVERPDGDLSYLVFVAPESDFASMQPVFAAMLKSFRAQ